MCNGVDRVKEVVKSNQSESTHVCLQCFDTVGWASGGASGM